MIFELCECDEYILKYRESKSSSMISIGNTAFSSIFYVLKCFITYLLTLCTLIFYYTTPKCLHVVSIPNHKTVWITGELSLYLFLQSYIQLYLINPLQIHPFPCFVRDVVECLG